MPEVFDTVLMWILTIGAIVTGTSVIILVIVAMVLLIYTAVEDIFRKD